jgi:uncharacterized membrane protein
MSWTVFFTVCIGSAFLFLIGMCIFLAGEAKGMELLAERNREIADKLLGAP